MTVNGMECCGVQELAELSRHLSAKEALIDLLENYGVPGGAFLIFTAVVGRNASYGERFAAFIEKEDLGTVVASPRARNPNSGHTLKVWVWTHNRRRLQAWLTRHDQEMDRKEKRTF